MGDLIYIFSDGYPDQFGGPQEKKFRYKHMQNLLISNSNKPLESQKRELERTFIQWKGNLEQVDDVLIIGIKI
jgi:serine phosphatase RsbU (regulator of sigma subunit)